MNGSHKKVVLVVDDEADVANLAQQFLALHDYEAVVALSGHEALAVMESRKVDMLFSDVMMPQMTGIELLNTTRELFPDVKCALTTGFVKVPGLPPCTILEKPYSMNALIQLAADLCA